MAFSFEKLIVYQKAVEFSTHIGFLVGVLPRSCSFLVAKLLREE